MCLRIGGYGPEDSSHGLGLATFRDHVTAATGGDVEIEVTWNIMEENRPNTDLLDLVEAGEMFLCYFSTSYLGDRVVELNVLETPFLFGDLKAAHEALDGALGDRLRSSIREATGFEALGYWDNGFRHITNRIRPIHSPGDCRDLSMRIQPNEVHAELVRSWGATPVAVELGEGIELLRSQQVDAQENPLANTVAYGVDEVHPHVTMTGHLYGARALLADRAAFEALPDDLRGIVTRGAVLAIEAQREAAARMEADLRRRLEANGLRFVDLTADERAAFASAASPAIDLARSMVPGGLYDLVAA